MDFTDMHPRIGSFQGCSPGGFHEVFYTDWGDPAATRVIVCCHGLTRNGRDFDVLAARLASGIDFALPRGQQTDAPTRTWFGAITNLFRGRSREDPISESSASLMLD